MLLVIALIILALWILGLAVHIGGYFINVLLVIGVIVLVYHLMFNKSINKN